MAEDTKKPEPKPAKPETKAAENPAVALVKMRRNPDHFPAPHAANVHPAEVQNYKRVGWYVPGE